jgi:hypothetical protein
MNSGRIEWVALGEMQCLAGKVDCGWFAAEWVSLDRSDKQHV